MNGIRILERKNLCPSCEIYHSVLALKIGQTPGNFIFLLHFKLFFWIFIRGYFPLIWVYLVIKDSDESDRNITVSKIQRVTVVAKRILLEESVSIPDLVNGVLIKVWAQFYIFWQWPWPLVLGFKNTPSFRVNRGSMRSRNYLEYLLSPHGDVP